MAKALRCITLNSEIKMENERIAEEYDEELEKDLFDEVEPTEGEL